MIQRYDDKPWYAGGKWRTHEEANKWKEKNGLGYRNTLHCKTKRKAIKELLKCPEGTVLTQWFYYKGKRYCRKWDKL